MVCDPDIFRAAKLLMDQHGENAPLRAAERVVPPFCQLLNLDRHLRRCALEFVVDT